MINYLTELLGQPVVSPSGERVARVIDAIAAQSGRLPTVSALFLKSGEKEGWIPVSHAEILQDGIRLKVPWEQIPEYSPADSDLRLQRDILDKQIVDVHDYRVVRVNDVRLAPTGDRFCVVGADASFRALVRRTGFGKPLETIAKLIRRPLHSNLIAWDDVETYVPATGGGGQIKLKIPHEKIARLHPADIADIVEQLDPQQRAEVIEALDVETAADTIEEMEDEEAAKVMATLEEERAADILEEMDPDEAADVLGDLSDKRSEELLERMEPEEAADVKELLDYDEECAGGLMTTEYIAVPENLTAAETIERIRELEPSAETIYYVYVVDADERLTGVLSLRDLIVAKPPSRPISEVMKTNVRFAQVTDHADDVAQTISRYNLLALPVVDDAHILQGIVTVDDVMELLVPSERRRKLPQFTVSQ